MVIRRFPLYDPTARAKTRRRLPDWRGVLVLLFGLGLLIYSLSNGGFGLPKLLYIPLVFVAAILEVKLALGLALIMAALATIGWGNGQELSTALPSNGLYMVLALAIGLAMKLGARAQRQSRNKEHLSSMYTQVLLSLANTVEVRDRHTQGHCERVASNAVVMGRAIGLSKKQLELLYWGALLHDLGKIGVPEYILLKSSKLSPGEYKEIMRHADYGADLLSSVSDDFKDIAQIVRSHHERWDGQGYPARLKADAIPLMSRIISVVDVFEALTSERPYRQPLAPDEALQHIVQGAHSQFDAQLVEVFVSLYEQGEIEISGDSDQLRRKLSLSFLESKLELLE